MKKSLLTFACLLLASAGVQAAEWGNISGKFVYDGDVPEPKLLHAKGANVKDGAVCAAQAVYKDDLVVDPDSKGIANVFIFLYRAPKDIHPEAANPEPKVYFDQENCVFSPHALVVQAGQTVEVLNSDPIAHNTHTYPLRNAAQNILIAPESGKGDGVDIETSTREILPHKVQCDYHPWMLAYWLVLDHPYAAASDAEGNFTIKNLPVGDHEFRVWHERAGWVEKKYKVSVKAGDNKLEPFVIAASKLEEE